MVPTPWRTHLQRQLDQLSHQHLMRKRHWHVDVSSVEFMRPGGRRIVNFGTNDYLGLRHDGRLVAAANHAMQVSGVGAGASPLVSGYSSLHAQLEDKLAQWQKSEASLVFTSGMSMNTGVIPALAGPNDLVLSDQLNHASLIDGCRLSGAHKRIFEHGNVSMAADLLKAERGKYERVLLITESVFSMDGDIAPLHELTRLCEEHQVGMLVDEAHATGVYGPSGAGLGEELDLSSRWLLKLGTLSKGIGTCGGFATGSQLVITFLVNRCRSYIFSTALAPPVVAASAQAIELIPELADRRQRLKHISSSLRTRLLEDGWNVPTGDSPIIPIIVGSSESAMELSARLLEANFFVPAIRPPTVPAGTSRLRLSLSAAHTDEHIAGLVTQLKSLNGRQHAYSQSADNRTPAHGG